MDKLRIKKTAKTILESGVTALITGPMTFKELLEKELPRVAKLVENPHIPASYVIDRERVERNAKAPAIAAVLVKLSEGNTELDKQERIVLQDGISLLDQFIEKRQTDMGISKKIMRGELTPAQLFTPFTPMKKLRKDAAKTLIANEGEASEYKVIRSMYVGMLRELAIEPPSASHNR
jgi:hypothetical protein